LDYLTYQITKPMIRYSQTLRDQLQHQVGTDRQCTCNITRRYIHITIVAMEKQ
jgi:hypothetical protein